MNSFDTPRKKFVNVTIERTLLPTMIAGEERSVFPAGTTAELVQIRLYLRETLKLQIQIVTVPADFSLQLVDERSEAAILATLMDKRSPECVGTFLVFLFQKRRSVLAKMQKRHTFGAAFAL